MLGSCIRSAAIALVVLAAASASARAQAAADTAHKFSGSGDFGLVNAAGNTSVTTLNVGEQLNYAPDKYWHVVQNFALVYGKTDGVESASLWQGNVRGDRDLGNRWGVYALLEFDRNTFASIDRRFQEGVGALYHPIRTATDTLIAEAGLGLVEKRSTADSLNPSTDNTQFIGRVAGVYRHGFAPKAYGEESLEILPDLQLARGIRINSATALVAPLYKTASLKAAYVINFDNDPEIGRKKTDRFLTTGVQLSF